MYIVYNFLKLFVYKIIRVIIKRKLIMQYDDMILKAYCK